MSELGCDELLGLALDFCARVTASATHEIKNELAVINEQARLVQELLAMAAQGKEPDLARLEQIIGRVVVRVGQADMAVRRLNAFAHSADLDRTQADAGRELGVIAPLFKRIAARHRATLALESEAPPAPVIGQPLLVEQAMWACLEAVAAQAEDKEVRLSVQRDGGQVLVRFAAELSGEPQEPPSAVLQPLGAKVRTLAGGGLELVLPSAQGAGQEEAG
ncbi:MAG: hypothetical protein PVG03_07580 [Desulfarculaceae bacterium]|jgi:signal transduction histidine kinase